MSKEHAYAYESGYQDGLRCAETENAKIVAELRENGYLKEENAKLRELVRDMWHQSCTYDTTCEGCPRYVKHWDGTEECEFETRIIKLGIEVGYEW